MSNKEAVYYVGLMGGIMIGCLGLQAMGIGGIVALIGGLVCGVGLGYVAERAYVARHPPKPPADQAAPPEEPEPAPLRDRRGAPILSQVCPNPQCGWAGDNR